MNAYEEKQERKLERFQELGQKAEQQSQAAYEHSNRLSSLIPFGQPILVGHHSEKTHRNHIKKIHNAMDQSVKLQDKAEYYKNKADNILNSTAISSDNPEATNLLKEKLKGLEEQRIKYKEHNKQARKENKESLPSYMLSNLSQNIRSVKKRIAYLESKKAIPEIDQTINGITIKTNKEDNRVRIFFPSIPCEELRTKLKRNGFRWSPYNKAWQRQLSEYALRIAKEIITEE